MLKDTYNRENQSEKINPKEWNKLLENLLKDKCTNWDDYESKTDAILAAVQK